MNIFYFLTNLNFFLKNQKNIKKELFRPKCKFFSTSSKFIKFLISISNTEFLLSFAGSKFINNTFLLKLL